MKRSIAVLLFSLFGIASHAAINSNYVSPVDVLAGHNNHGRGCVGCHAPHSGPAGSGISGATAITGNLLLWGQDVGKLAGTTLLFGGGAYAETLPINDQANSPDLVGIVLCLSCHDGNLAKGAMMTGVVDWTAEGLNPSALGYGTSSVPTWLGNDGGAGGAGNYRNDHPVGLNAVVTPFSDATLTVYSYWSKEVPAGPISSAFAANYGFTARLSASGGRAVVMCTTCHDQHVMTVYKGTIAGTSGFYQTQFGIRGYYNPTLSSSNSTLQFCRQCHPTRSNEANGILNVPTT